MKRRAFRFTYGCLVWLPLTKEEIIGQYDTIAWVTNDTIVSLVTLDIVSLVTLDIVSLVTLDIVSLVTLDIVSLVTHAIVSYCPIISSLVRGNQTRHP
jgi:hypothetical protein